MLTPDIGECMRSEPFVFGRVGDCADADDSGPGRHQGVERVHRAYRARVVIETVVPTEVVGRPLVGARARMRSIVTRVRNMRSRECRRA